MIRFFQISPLILEISWKAEISKAVLYEIIDFKQVIKEKYGSLLKDCVSGYSTLCLRFHSPYEKETLVAELEELYYNLTPNEITKPILWKLPVFYNGKDLSSFSDTLSIEELIHRHTATDYILHFYGFMPGFIYLGGLDPKLHRPRKVNPDKSIPAGSVAIGGKQTGIYPSESPGGWHILGTCPVKMFDPSKNPAVWAKEGDIIRFYEVEQEEYEKMKLLGTGLIKEIING
jgi:KipI family sensor histidine kinase inhibitor